MRCTVVLEQEPDGGYVVSVPALPGCISQGDTRSEALANIREVIALYIEDCRDAGNPVPTQAGKGVKPTDRSTITRSP
jgi:predicted RNase H-like HicB family nuclease